jgi:hypothetical protein
MVLPEASASFDIVLISYCLIIICLENVIKIKIPNTYSMLSLVFLLKLLTSKLT